MKSRLAVALVGMLGLSTIAVIGTSTAASAATHFDSPPQVLLGWTDSATPATGHPSDGETDLPLGTWQDEAGGTHTSRVYVTWDLSQFEGKKMYGGKLWVQERSAADCTKRDIEIWRTRAVSATPKWRNPPAPLTKLDEIQTPEYCPRATIEFDVSAAVLDAVQRKQRLVTFELRVSAGNEADPAYGRRLSTSYGVRFTAEYNSVPQIHNANLYTSGFGCTQLKPYPKYPGGLLEALGTDADADDDPRMRVEFAIWPVGRPEERTTLTDTAFPAGRVASVRVPEADLVDGTSYAWQARVTDGVDTSPWSRKCFFSYDGIAPTAPAVTSDFPEGTWGPAGKLPTFTFDGQGNKDVAGFQYGWWGLGVDVCSAEGDVGQTVCTPPFSGPGTVRANTPGGTAAVTLNPDASGPIRLVVRSVDAAGKVSPTVTTTVYISSSEPNVEVDSGTPVWNREVRLKLTPRSGIAVTEYEIQRRGVDGTETRTADESGTAYYAFTATEMGPHITVRSISPDGFRSAPSTWQHHFDPAPGVTSDIYDSTSTVPTGGVGVEGTFTFSPPPGWAEVATYRYRFGRGAQTEVEAGPDGTASITWTPTESGSVELTVHAVRADGTMSEYPNWYWFEVA
ncbi:hypothetical protein [Paractinoplanes rishiriensis]|uniref:Uncharacterized protein n=1 Tax=Paractinoplanes rishiriensis TaxID=1050105 RepID=A0A919K7G3_9ACTN|nr:hypothetical protein [Actinoplanes rishiriensis]GIF01474.1 hypothetical protein Ari01nite_89380 [Actinoplanes rishiriensis]